MWRRVMGEVESKTQRGAGVGVVVVPAHRAAAAVGGERSNRHEEGSRLRSASSEAQVGRWCKA